MRSLQDGLFYKFVRQFKSSFDFFVENFVRRRAFAFFLVHVGAVVVVGYVEQIGAWVRARRIFHLKNC
jgi:hypothetical protein